ASSPGSSSQDHLGPQILSIDARDCDEAPTMGQPDVFRGHIERLQYRSSVAHGGGLVIVQQPLWKERHQLLDGDLPGAYLRHPQTVDRDAAQRFAVGVLKALDQCADVRATRALD